MLSTQVQSAVQALQAQALATGDSYRLDVTDRALDELLRNPTCGLPAAYQVRSSRANAAKVVRSRRQRYDEGILRNREPRPGVHRQDRLAQQPDEITIDTLDWLARTDGLTEGQRRILCDLADDHDAHSISIRDGVPPTRVHEHISRARRAGRQAYQHEVVASWRDTASIAWIPGSSARSSRRTRWAATSSTGQPSPST